MSAYNFVHSGRNFTKSFVQGRRDRAHQHCLDFVAIFIGSRNICTQTQKLS